MFDGLMRLIGFGLCHQLPERSLFGGVHQLPVCARDTGIYLGFAVSALLIASYARRRGEGESPPLPMALLSLVFIGAMAVDGTTSYLGLRQTTNDLRLLTGLLSGFAIAAFTVPLVAGQLLRRPPHKRVLSRTDEVAVWLAAIPVTFGAAKWLLPLAGAAYAALVAAAVLFTLTAVNLVLVGLVASFDGSVSRLSHVRAPVLWALGLTAAELALAGALRSALLSLL